MNHIEQASYHRQHIETKDTNIPKQANRQTTNTNKVHKFHEVNAILHAAHKDQHRRAIPREYNINETYDCSSSVLYNKDP